MGENSSTCPLLCAIKVEYVSSQPPATVPRAEARILIATAGFGDGHNSAARNLAEALEGRALAKVVDPIDLGAPRLNKKLKGFYRFVTTYLPKVWYKIYQGTDRQNFDKRMLPFMRALEGALAEEINEFQPDVFVCTYPLYPYSYRHALKDGLVTRLPLVTVVTDSIEINGTWLNAKTDHWLVTDEWTKRRMIEEGCAGRKIVETGFAVSPKFIKMEGVEVEDGPKEELRVLFFPTAIKPHVRRVARKLLEDSRVTVTIVLGRNFRKLYSRALQVKKNHPGRVKIKGWTRKVPELLCSHDLVIGKAGGATTHEALSAQCPMWIHHLVPGQEEGNVSYLRKLGVGELVEKEKDIPMQVERLLENGGAKWKEIKRRLKESTRPEGAVNVADFVMNIVTEHNEEQDLNT